MQLQKQVQRKEVELTEVQRLEEESRRALAQYDEMEEDESLTPHSTVDHAPAISPPNDAYGFRQLVSDPCMFVKRTGDKEIILPLYVDDMPGAATSQKEIDDLLDYLRTCGLKLSSGPLIWFMRMHIQRSVDGGFTHISQGAYLSKVVDRWGVKSSKSRSLPGTPGEKLLSLCRPGGDADVVPQMKSLVPTLGWLTNTRPAIIFHVHMLARCIHIATVQVLRIALDVICPSEL